MTPNILTAVLGCLSLLAVINMYLGTGAVKIHSTNRVYGWHPSTKPSPHPRYIMPEGHKAGYLPKSVDLEPGCPPVYDQLQLGSCTGNALAGLFEFLLIKLGLPSFVPSRLMIYWGERAIEGTKDQDAGANGDDGITFLMTKGVCPESSWPYNPDKFSQIPPPECWSEAAHHKLTDPITIDNTVINEIKSCLASGFPIAFGFFVFEELESDSVAKNGILPMPALGEQSIGGHAVLIVGYNDATKMFKIRNSWGPGWGLNGYFFMPYAYATNPKLASDFRSAKVAS
jgi:C1A family cysteine protease